MHAATTTEPTRRAWFWPAAAYTVAWTACLVAVEWVVWQLTQRRIDATCDSAVEQDGFLCGFDEGLDRLFAVVAAYFAVLMFGLVGLGWIRRRRLTSLRPAWIVAFVTVFGQLVAGMVAWAVVALFFEATVVWTIWGLLWLAAPMVGMRMWLLSDEPAA